MFGLIIISLLSVGALTTFIVEELDDDDDDGTTSTPTTPGDDDPVTDGDDDPGLIGGAEPDLITGTRDSDLIEGNDGDDRLFAGDGNDQVNGGDGSDRLSGDDGDDLLFGGSGDDSIFGGDDSDIASGGEGDDSVWGGSADDLLIGGDGADTLVGSTGDDILIGTQSDIGDGTAAEFLAAIDGASSEGDAAEALLDAINVPEAGGDDDQGDVLSGGHGDDAFLIGSEDTATGGGGDDVFNLGDWIQVDRAATISDYTPGDDVIAFSYSSTDVEPEMSVSDDGEGNAVITADGDVVATVTGAAGTLTVDDILLIGDAPTDGLVLDGTEGDDTLEGSEYNDLVASDLGNDLILGLGGADIIRGNEGNDLIDTGEDDDRAFGGDGDDTMLGQQGNDFLRGSAGDDLIVDTDGSDTLRGDVGDDIIISGSFVDTAALSASLQGGGSFDPASLNLSEDTDSQGDLLFGGLGSDTLYFGANDTVSGGGDADTFITTDAAFGTGSSVITDFDTTEDVIIVSVADGNTPDFEISYTLGSTEDSGDAIVTVGDSVVMVLQGVGTGFTAANIVLQSRPAA